MSFLGLELSIRNKPELDPSFLPLHAFNEAFLSGARKPIGIAVERSNGQMAAVETFIHGEEAMREADRYYIERLVKTLLWMKGGFRVYVRGDDDMAEYLRGLYCAGGRQAFDWDYMASVFEHPFEIVTTDALPAPKDDPKAIGGHRDGCRIGFDAGGSDRKVSAVIDGEPVYSEEVVWFPKINSDPDYHYNGIVAALRSAAEHLPRVDAVGVSSAGVYIDNRTMNASLFLKVPQELFEQKVKDIYIRAITDTFGDVPYSVVNDGDVTALAGSMSLGVNNVLGIAMGTSEAVGYVDPEGRITGWLNELAFVPVDANPEAMRDEWSGDIGCGVKYFSQDGVIKLAAPAGIELDDALSPAEKLKAVQKLMEADDPRAAAIYRSIGVYLAHSLAYYYDLYAFETVLLLGRVMSGKGGDILLETCRSVLADEYPALPLRLALPDETFRRVGQSAVAASLPELRHSYAEVSLMKKHIVCFGDSNTHGYCADPADCADGGDRFNEDERWTCLLQRALGEGYLVLEEGLSGRTTVFPDPLHESMAGLDVIYSTLMSHEPVDLLIVMLGTNDTKARLGVNAACIGLGLERLVLKAKSVPAWRGGTPNILLIAPPHIGEGLYLRPEGETMGPGCPEKSRALAAHFAAVAARQGCAFLDAEGVAEFNRLDCMHLSRLGHRQLSERLAALVPELLR